MAEDLSSDYKLQIQRYMLRLMLLPSVVIALVAGTVGFLIERGAAQQAYNEAYRDALSDVTAAVVDATTEARRAQSQAQAAAERIAQAEKTSTLIVERLGSLDATQQIDSLVAQVAPLVANILATAPKVFVSDAFRLPAGGSTTHAHTLGAIPAVVQVWSSASDAGPWELVTANFYQPVGTAFFYGVWVTDVSADTITLQSGATSATSTYGSRNHWDRYHAGRSNYTQTGAFFRFTAVSER